MWKKKCELCNCLASLFCESDQACLCWDCDRKVHGANFLVAKHTRCLLCSTCQFPTPWNASGLYLGPTVSACYSCLVHKKNSGAGNLIEEIDCNGDQLREDDGAESCDDDDEGEEEAENQVVPWNAAQQPPVISSSSSVSSGDEAFSGDGGLMVKRTRRDLDLNRSYEESDDARPLKRLSRDETSPRSTAVMKPTLRLNGETKSNGGVCHISSSSSSSSSTSSTVAFKTANKSRNVSR